MKYNIAICHGGFTKEELIVVEFEKNLQAAKKVYITSKELVSKKDYKEVCKFNDLAALLKRGISEGRLENNHSLTLLGYQLAETTRLQSFLYKIRESDKHVVFLGRDGLYYLFTFEVRSEGVMEPVREEVEPDCVMVNQE